MLKQARLPGWSALAGCVAVASVSLALAGCTTSAVPPMEIALADVASQASMETGDEGSADGFAPSAASQGDADLSAQVADGTAVAATAEGDVTPAADTATPGNGAMETVNDETQTAESALATARVAQAAGPLPVPSAAPRQGPDGAGQPASAGNSPETGRVQVASATPQLEKRGFLSSLFSTQPPRPTQALQKAERTRSPAAAPKTNPAARKAVRTASLSSDLPPGATGSLTALPGVRAESLFEITRKSGGYDDSDVDINEADDAPVRVASVTGLARLAPNGLAVQTASVDVACLKPQLVRVLKTVERHYGQKVVVTSGYRSPKRNRRARGAKNSLHMYCAAADIQVSGVSKWDLAKFLRTMPGRGGVGTYCHTKSVHIDIGPERDWNWRCRRSSRKRK